MFCAYVLRSEANGRLYKGSCGNLDIRLQQHNSGKVRSTRPFRPWILVHSETFPTRSEAFHREQHWKTVEGAKELKGILTSA